MVLSMFYKPPIREERELWNEFDKLFKEVGELFDNNPFYKNSTKAPIPPQIKITTTQNREAPFVTIGEDITDLRKKYDELKVFVTNLEKDNRRLQEELETAKIIKSVHFNSDDKRVQMREALSRVIDVLQLLINKI